MMRGLYYNVVMAVLGLMATSFLLNLPMGIWRGKTGRISPLWLVVMHLIVVVLILMRRFLHLNLFYIPLSLSAGILAQFIGRRFGRNAGEAGGLQKDLV